MMLKEKIFGKSYCSIEPATAILAGSAIGAGGNIFSSIFGAGAAKQQANAIKEAAETASRTALELDNRARADVAPFRQLGLDASDIVSRIMKGEINLDEALGSSSIFKWQQSEGERAINRELSARGLYGSGAGLETLARFNNQLVAEEGSRYWDRLFNTTTLGANASARMATNTTSIGANVANLQAQAGIARAGAIGDAGRSIASIGPGVAGPVMGGISSMVQYDLYRPLIDRMSGGGSRGGSSAVDMDFNPAVFS